MEREKTEGKRKKKWINRKEKARQYFIQPVLQSRVVLNDSS